MTDRALKPLERFARRICWLEFTPPRTKARIGYTEAKYWKSLPQSRRDQYIEEARRYQWIHGAMQDTKSSAMLHWAVVRHD